MSMWVQPRDWGQACLLRTNVWIRRRRGRYLLSYFVGIYLVLQFVQLGNEQIKCCARVHQRNWQQQECCMRKPSVCNRKCRQSSAPISLCKKGLRSLTWSHIKSGSLGPFLSSKDECFCNTPPSWPFATNSSSRPAKAFCLLLSVDFR